MDFHSLNRRDLQSLCKLNKIPANITNVAMADALKCLHTVEGIQEFLNPSRSETVGSSVDSPEKVDVMSPRIPQTSCRTSTRQNAKKTDVESLPATATRTTSRGVRRQLGREVNELEKTPLVTSTRKNVPTTASRQNVLTQLNECEEVEKSECLQSSRAAVATCNRKKETVAATRQDTVKKESAVQGVYSTRRSMRLTAKKSAEPGAIEKGKSQPLKMGSFLEVSLTSEEKLCNLSQEKTGDSGSGSIETSHESTALKEKVEDICNAFEKLDVVVVNGSHQNLKAEKPPCVDATLEIDEEKEDCSSTLDDIKVKSIEMVDQHEKNRQEDNQKPDSDDVSDPFEDVDSEEKITVADEIVDLNETRLNVSVKEQNVNLASEEKSEDMSVLCEGGDLEEKLLVADTKVDLNEALNFSVKEQTASLEHSNENRLADADVISKLTSEDMSAVSEMKNEVSEFNGSPNSVDSVHFNFEHSSELSKLDNLDNHNIAEEMTADNIEMEISSNTVEEDKTINEEDGDGKPKISIRQLKKQLKALSIKNNVNANKDEKVTEARPALQSVRENQLTTGEMEN